MSDRDILIGAAVGVPVAALKPWAASARRQHAGRIVLLAEEPSEYIFLDHAYGVELRTAHLNAEPKDPNSVWKHRWEALRAFLNRAGPESGLALFVDCTDAIFQRDPFAALQGDPRIAVATEGRPYHQCAWNRARLKQYYKSFEREMIDETCLCAGVVGGPVTLLENFAALVFGLLTGMPGDADQTAFNIIARGFEAKGALAVKLYHETAWACHCAQMYPGSQWFQKGPRSEALITLAATDTGPEVCNDMGVPFAIVHHWDDAKSLHSFGAIA